jgi:microcystin-dependent protein
MAPYVGEIRMFGGNFAPNGWMFCQGQTLPISENEVLFQLIGTTFGGDGEETFQLPNLGGRLPAHQGTPQGGTQMQLGEAGGVPEVTLSTQQLPSHTHPFLGAQTGGNEINAGGNLPANSATVTPYINQAPDGSMNAQAITQAGGSQPHDNMQPYLCINFIISLFGVFPSQT